MSVEFTASPSWERPARYSLPGILKLLSIWSKLCFEALETMLLLVINVKKISRDCFFIISEQRKMTVLYFWL